MALAGSVVVMPDRAQCAQVACFKIATVQVAPPLEQLDSEGFPVSRAGSAAISSTGSGQVNSRIAAAAAHISASQHGVPTPLSRSAYEHNKTVTYFPDDTTACDDPDVFTCRTTVRKSA